jgi:DUF971 family protein
MSEVPSNITVKKSHSAVQLSYGSDVFLLPYEFLRVYSPSAQVRGHGEGNEVLQYGKKDIGILNIEPVGNYALKITFDDGHDSGLYHWSYLFELCHQYSEMWASYLEKLQESGLSRNAENIQFTSIS